jgi:hypothetical protein
MITKVLEIRDKGTHIPALAIKLVPSNEDERYVLERGGYSDACPQVLLIKICYPQANYDSEMWGGGRTMVYAHRYIMRYFDELTDGDVIDVQFILGETTEKKVSERYNKP